ncbi:MAG: hypothetical protein KZQ93_13270 [Candidatus Thiodiazotropha sp. (ex Monitilora ramsayi)]|nr:hypothetical protein [Candidatus Thiodiazotropha sp. (ex Monitilora ramsayi)]
MRINNVERAQSLSRYVLIALLTLSPLTSTLAQEDTQAVDNDEPQQLAAEEVQALDGVLSEMKVLAPKLRVTLRSVRQQLGFDAREIHKVERNINHSQKDIERLIAMHRRGAVNQMRAHFLVDDLRRKADGLRESLNYVVLHVREQASNPDGGANDSDAGKDNDALIELLGLYSALVDNSVVMLQGKAF